VRVIPDAGAQGCNFFGGNGIHNALIRSDRFDPKIWRGGRLALLRVEDVIWRSRRMSLME
jgi:hypothetical protein